MSVTFRKKPEHPISCIIIAYSGLLLSLKVFKFKENIRLVPEHQWVVSTAPDIGYLFAANVKYERTYLKTGKFY